MSDAMSKTNTLQRVSCTADTSILSTHNAQLSASGEAGSGMRSKQKRMDLANWHHGQQWDLTAFFPDFDSPPLAAFKQALCSDVAALLKDTADMGSLAPENAPEWEALILRFEDIGMRSGHLSAYLEALSACDAANEVYRQAVGEMNRVTAGIEKMKALLGQALNSAAPGFIDLFLARDRLREISYALDRLRQSASFKMDQEKEALAADLNIDGIHAWERLYHHLSGKLTFTMRFPDGHRETRPVAQLRGLLAHPDSRIGRAAFEGGNRAWSRAADICAAALNAIAGGRLTMQRHRGIDHFLAPALFDAGIQKETLAAMYEAVYTHLDLARAVYRFKVNYLRRKGIWFYEREAALPLTGAGNIPWTKALAMVRDAFRSMYPELGDYFSNLAEARWIESALRPGKRPGAFCVNSNLIRQARIYMNYSGSLADVKTLAHEAGHAWHGHMLHHLRPLAQPYPMPIAETAALFCERLLTRALLKDARLSDIEKLCVMDTELCGAAVLLLDITCRFEFEKQFYQERHKGEVSVSRLKELMRSIQRRIYGDVLLDNGADPLFWASKLHFYFTEVSFYNFPYTFGFLLASALHQRFEAEGGGFLPRYELFLKKSGSDTVEGLIRKVFNADIGRTEFWADAIQSLSGQVAVYSKMLHAVGAEENGRL